MSVNKPVNYLKLRKRRGSNICRQPIFHKVGDANLNAQLPFDLSKETDTCNSSDRMT